MQAMEAMVHAEIMDIITLGSQMVGSFASKPYVTHIVPDATMAEYGTAVIVPVVPSALIKHDKLLCARISAN
jgi:hypothetical protein